MITFNEFLILLKNYRLHKYFLLLLLVFVISLVACRETGWRGKRYVKKGKLITKILKKDSRIKAPLIEIGSFGFSANAISREEYLKK